MIDLTTQQLEMSVQTTASPSRSVRKAYKEPLGLEDQKFIEWLADRYEGKDGTPVMTFACNGILTLLVPPNLRMKRLPRESFSVEAKSILRFSNGEGE